MLASLNVTALHRDKVRSKVIIVCIESLGHDIRDGGAIANLPQLLNPGVIISSIAA
jgi:hypothetical protein